MGLIYNYFSCMLAFLLSVRLLMEFTIKDYLEKLETREINVEDILKQYKKKAQNNNYDYNAFIRFHKNERLFDDLQKIDLENSKLKGAVIGIKDNILLKGTENACSSKILEGFIAPYTATCIQNLQKNGGIVLGKTNMDEFAMGSSNENSSWKPAVNKYGNNRVTGGSSGGSSVAVSADLCFAALGTDTGGSVRQPAAFCNVVGMKPTYGMVSRYGVQSMASSFDQVGVITKTVGDAKIMLDSIRGYDVNDSQSNIKSNEDFFVQNKDLSKYKLALPKQFIGEGLDPLIKDKFEKKLDFLKTNGVQIDIIDLPILDGIIAIYYILMSAEASTNLARFDGLRFGLQKSTHNFDSIMDYIQNIRTKGFGEEVKRRILLGTYVLSSSNYEGYYLKAKKARLKLQEEFIQLFKNYDFIISPTSPILAWEIGDDKMDPLSEYLADIYTVTSNLLGNPAISIPMGLLTKDGEEFSTGFHLIGDKRTDFNLLDFAEKIS